MIKFLAAAVFFAGIAAQAMPAIGDKASHKLTITQGGVPAAYVYDMSFTSYDTALSQFNLHIAVTLPDGSVQERDEWLAGADAMDDAYVQAVLENCAMVGGTPEVLTVPAGTFDTCKLVNQDGSGTAWFAKVAFGFAKTSQISNGYTIDFELQSFTMGQR